MTVETQLREYRATLDAATETAAAAHAQHDVVPIRTRPARALLVAVAAVAAAIAIAFAAVGLTHKSSTPPATSPSITVAPPTTIGPPSGTVLPDVVGMHNNPAVDTLLSFGFSVVTTTPTTCHEAPGVVVAETPAPGAHVPAHTRVTLAVCPSPTPGTLGGANITLPVTMCPTEYGILPSASDPKAPTTLTIPRPPFTDPTLAGYSDLRGYLPITAPAGWKCKSIEATDGGQGIGVTPPGATPRDSWGQGNAVTKPLTDGVFALADPACQGCVRGEVCGIVPTAAADFPDFASQPCPQPAGQTVTPLGHDVYRIDDPPGTLGPDAAHSILRYTPRTAGTDAQVIRETCILPAAQHAVCDALFAEFLASRPTPWTQPDLTITPTSLGAVEIGLSRFAAQEAAGLTFDGQGDGFAYPQSLMNTGTHVYVGLGTGSSNGDGNVVCVGAEIVNPSHLTPRVTTPEGFALGGTVAQLLAIYGSRATFVPAPKSGMSPNAGYVVHEAGGVLAFAVNPNTHVVFEIAGGGADLTPSTCTG